MTPQRIQLRRIKGWRKPEGAIVVARPSRWGNPWKPEMVFGGGHAVGFQARGPLFTCGPTQWTGLTAYAGWRRLHATDAHRDCLINCVDFFDGWAKTLNVADLAGHDLACWCPLDQPCHADVLLKLANP